MDTARYFLALIMVISFPAAVGFWLVAHPLAGFWRKLGAPFAYTVLVTLMLGIAYGMYRISEPLLFVDFGTSWPLIAFGVVLYLVAAYLEVRCRRVLELSTLVGVPELRRAGGGELLDRGIYGRMRHPRYVSVMFGTAGMAFITNYLAIYVMVVLLVPAFHLIALLEERELVERLGEAYRDYQRRVPRFIRRRRA